MNDSPSSLEDLMEHNMHNGQAQSPATSAGGDGNTMMRSTMFFHFGTEEVILFRFWNVKSGIGIFIACLLILFACFLLELLRWFSLARKKGHRVGSAKPSKVVGGTNVYNYSGKTGAHGTQRNRTMTKLGDAALHGTELALNNLFMLIFMTFNVWLCAAAVLGSSIARLAVSLWLPDFYDPDR